MAVVAIDPFDFRSPWPPDLRLRRDDISGRDSIPTNHRWEGMLVYVMSDQTWYYLSGGIGNENWAFFGGSDGTQNVTFLTNMEPTGGADGDISFVDNTDDSVVQVWYRVAGVWAMLGQWSYGGGSAYIEDAAMPSTPTLTYLNDNYPNANAGDVVYREGSTQVIVATCYASGKWKWITENIAQ